MIAVRIDIALAAQSQRFLHSEWVLVAVSCECSARMSRFNMHNILSKTLWIKTFLLLGVLFGLDLDLLWELLVLHESLIGFTWYVGPVPRGSAFSGNQIPSSSSPLHFCFVPLFSVRKEITEPWLHYLVSLTHCFDFLWVYLPAAKLISNDFAKY